MPGATPGPQLQAELIAFCHKHLAKMKSPKSIDFTDALPRLPTGKLYKKALRDKYWEGRKTRIV
jgi:long-chain acyl-CoA synthetase